MDVLHYCVTTTGTGGRSVSTLPIPTLSPRREGLFPYSTRKVYPRLLLGYASSSSSSSGGSVHSQGGSPPPSQVSTKIVNRESSVNIESRFNPEDSSFPEQGYLGLFVRSLGLDNPAEEREEAVRALWRYSMQGNDAVDEIMKFPGILTLIVRLLPSPRIESAEAAAGLLRNISEVHTHRLAIAEAGAIEEIVGIFTRRSPALEVIQQAMRAVWNLSVEENLRSKLAYVEFLSVLVAMFDSFEELEKEATAGILANLALSISNHELLVEARVVPKLSSLLKSNSGSKNTRRAARNTLLELAKDKDIKLSIIEEGLVPVPLIGADAYRSFKPLLTGLSAIPDDIKVEKSSRGPSPFGAGELLLGLRGGKELEDIDKATWLLNEGRLRQEFLARIGVIEGDMKGKLGGDRGVKQTLLTLPRNLTIPIVEEDRWSRGFAVVSASLSPPFFSLVLALQGSELFGSGTALFMVGTLVGILLGLIAFYTTSSESPPTRCLFPWVAGGFVMSIVWFYLLANELVGLLVTLGKIMEIDPSVLGLTVLAWGNSMGDLMGNIALASNNGDGLQIAMSGCYAGPMFNILAGLGISLLLGAFRSYPLSFVIPRDGSLFYTLGFLIIGLLWALVALPMNGMHPNKALGVGLLVLYALFLGLRLGHVLGIITFLG